MAEIAVAGLGHGGIVAAKILAEKGHAVTVFSKESYDNIGLEQKDSLDASALTYAGLEIPERFRAPGNVITFIPLNEDTESVTLPAGDSYENLTVDRRDFLLFLIEKAKKAGVKFVFDCAVTGPIMLGSRVGGIKTDNGNFYFDLIIDACGVHSALRNNLPLFTLIEKEPNLYDVLHTYRAYFNKIPCTQEPETKYNIYLKYDGNIGFSWIITEEDSVDVLIARFHNVSYPEIAQELKALSEYNPQMGSSQIMGGKIIDIPIRQPLSVLVADGYAAVGDSAFMTYAVKGSGLAYSIKAGKILADAVSEDSECLFNCDTLWKYQRTFFKEIGFDACRIALAKNLLPYFSAKEVDQIFKCGLVTSEELSLFASADFSEILKSNLPALLKEKIKILGECPEFKAHLLQLISWIARFSVLEPFLPNKYERDEVEKWAEKYTSFFESLRRPN